MTKRRRRPVKLQPIVHMNAPALRLVRDVRRCEFCRRPLPKGKRADARTCGQSCRQKLHRKETREVSCEATIARRVDVPILSAAARARAGFSTSVPTRTKRVVLVGKVHGREVSID